MWVCISPLMTSTPKALLRTSTTTSTACSLPLHRSRSPPVQPESKSPIPKIRQSGPATTSRRTQASTGSHRLTTGLHSAIQRTTGRHSTIQRITRRVPIWRTSSSSDWPSWFLWFCCWAWPLSRHWPSTASTDWRPPIPPWPRHPLEGRSDPLMPDSNPQRLHIWRGWHCSSTTPSRPSSSEPRTIHTFVIITFTVYIYVNKLFSTTNN